MALTARKSCFSAPLKYAQGSNLLHCSHTWLKFSRKCSREQFDDWRPQPNLHLGRSWEGKSKCWRSMDQWGIETRAPYNQKLWKEKSATSSCHTNTYEYDISCLSSGKLSFAREIHQWYMMHCHDDQGAVGFYFDLLSYSVTAERSAATGGGCGVEPPAKSHTASHLGRKRGRLPWVAHLGNCQLAPDRATSNCNFSGCTEVKRIQVNFAEWSRVGMENEHIRN